MKNPQNQTNSEWWKDYYDAAQQLYGGQDMKVRETGGGGDFEPAPAGTHIARCHQIIDLGTHYSEMYDNHRHQVYIGFELPNEMRTYKDEDGEKQAPFIVGKFYTASLNEKANLRHDLESWRGRSFTGEELEGFDLKNILGVPALVNIVHEEKNGKTRAKISSVSKPMKGMECPSQHNETVNFSLEEFSQEDFQKVPKGFQDMIRKSEEWIESHSDNGPAPESENPAPANDTDEDSIPF